MACPMANKSGPPNFFHKQSMAAFKNVVHNKIPELNSAQLNLIVADSGRVAFV